MSELEEAAPGTPPPRKNPYLLGQATAEDEFLRALEAGRLAHAWLLTGPRGVGKATLAYRMARFVLARPGGLFGELSREGDREGPGEGAEGGLYLAPESGVFRRVASGGHADFLGIEREVNEKTDKLRNEITVAQVRAVGHFLSLTPAEGGWRVVVIDSADEMNISAANALLKVLEEPPRRALLLLVSHNAGRLLPTIRSRCRHLAVRPLAEGEMIACLARYRPQLDPADAALLARICEGSLGRALGFAEEGGLALYHQLMGLLGALPEVDMVALHGLGDRLAGDRENKSLVTVRDLLLWWLARLIRQSATDGTALEGWIQAWDGVSHLLSRAQTANLDNKQLILNVFFILQKAAKAAPC